MRQTFVLLLGLVLVSANTQQLPSIFDDPNQLDQFLSQFQVGGTSEASLPSSLGKTLSKFGAAAATDECFFGVGDARNHAVDKTGYGTCVDSGGKLKTNEAYPWGVTVASGITVNKKVIVAESLFGSAPPSTPNVVCSDLAHDFRTPGIHAFDVSSEGVWSLNDLSSVLPASAKALLSTTLGLRSAGNARGVAFLAGGATPQQQQNGVNFFAFDVNTNNFLGAYTYTSGSVGDVRKWLNFEDQLFVGVGQLNGIGVGSNGQILKWKGTVSGTVPNDAKKSKVPIDASSFIDQNQLFNFVLVAEHLDGLAAEVVIHNDHVFVHTWPGGLPSKAAGLWKSDSAISATFGDSTETFTKVFTYAANYEPDVYAGATYAGGPMASFQGKLYFGTMHVPFSGFLAFMKANPSATSAQQLIAALATWRSTQVFRWADPQVGQDSELLYGGSIFSTQLSSGVWDGKFFTYDGSFETNKLNGGQGTAPKFGSGGFNWPFNSYTWSMRVTGDQLYIGTFDSSVIFMDELLGGDLLTIHGKLKKVIENNLNLLGADVWRVYDDTKPFAWVTKDGFGNKFNYGVRNLAALSDGRLIAGMANPFNLAGKDGGFELWALKFQPLAFKK